MKWTTLFQVELTKIRRSKILLLLILPAVILWVPNVMNASLNFQMDDIGISPGNSFMIQGFMGLAWFLYPAFLVVLTVLLWQTERRGRGIVKMLSLPANISSRLSSSVSIVRPQLAHRYFSIFHDWLSRETSGSLTESLPRLIENVPSSFTLTVSVSPIPSPP